jgi:L-rhamnose isomerase
VIAAPAIESVLPILTEVDEQLSEHRQIPPELFRQWVNLAKTKLLQVSEN